MTTEGTTAISEANRAYVENMVANTMTEWPRLCPTRAKTVDMLADAYAVLIAGDVAAGRTPDPETVQRYAALAAERDAL